MKVYLPGVKKQLYNFSQKPSSLRQTSPYSVSDIIKNQKLNSSFVFSHTKQVCNTISTLFEGIAVNEKQNIQYLRNLTKNIHLSSFRSWKQLRQTSFSIRKVLNQKISSKKIKLSRMELNLLCLILDSINYELDFSSDKSFIESQILPSIDYSSLKFNFDDLHMLHAFSCHSQLFERMLIQRKDLEKDLLQLTDQSFKSQVDGLRYILLTNIVKNGLYQDRWTSQFLKSVKQILLAQPLKKQSQSLLNAINLHTLDPNPSKQNQWHLAQKMPNQQASNIQTEIQIVNILKEMDYNVQTSQCLFNYEVDFKIGKNFIVEFHGIHHYRTSTNEPIQTKKSNWKIQCLKKQGYKDRDEIHNIENLERKLKINQNTQSIRKLIEMNQSSENDITGAFFISISENSFKGGGLNIKF